MELRHILDALLRRKRLFLRAFFAVLMAGAAFSLILRDNYTASSKILVAKSFAGEQILFSVSGTSLSDKKADMERQIELLKSSAVMSEVVKELDLRDASGGLLKADNILDRIRVKPVWEADMIEIIASSDKPGEASALANSVARQYIKWVQKVKKEESDNMKKYLASEMEALKNKQKKLEKDIAAFKKAHPKESLSEGLIDKADKDAAAIVERSKIEAEIKRTTTGGLFGHDSARVSELHRQMTVLDKAISKHEKDLKELSDKQKKLYGFVRDRRVYNVLYPAFVGKLNDMRVSEALNTVPVQIVSFAGSERRPVRSKGPASFLAVILAAVFAGFISVFVADYIDQTIKSPEDVRSDLGTMLIGQTPPIELPDFSRKNEVLIGKDNEYDGLFALLKPLCAEIKGAVGPAEHAVVAFSSPAQDSGRSLIAAAMAFYLASAGEKVLLVDADIRSGMQSKIYSQPAAEGFAEALAGDKDAFNFVKKTSNPFIEVLFAGDHTLYENSLVNFDRAKIRDILKKFAAIYSAVIVDCPAADGKLGAVEVASSCDIAVMVIPEGRLDKKTVSEAFSLLKSAGTRFIGAVLSAINTRGCH